jgi:hypothetical protein
MPIGIFKRQPSGQVKPPAGAVIDWGHPLANGLACLYPLNEGGGQVVHDLVNSRNNLLCNSSALFIDSQGLNLLGAALITDTASVASSVGLPLLSTSPWTLECLQAMTSATLTAQISFGFADIEAHNSFGNVKRFIMRFSGSPLTYYLFTDGSDFPTTIPYNTDGSIHHIVFTFDGVNKHSFYRDGVLLKTQTLALGTTLGSGIFMGGCDSAIGGSGPFIGRIFKASVYRRMLSATEVGALYANPFAMLRQTSLARYAFAKTVSSALISQQELRAQIIGSSDSQQEAGAQAFFVTAVSPEESAGSVAQTKTTSEESIGGVSQPAVSQEESRTSVSLVMQTKVSQHESISPIASSSDAFQESRGMLRAPLVSPQESTGVVISSAVSNQANRGDIFSSSDSQQESNVGQIVQQAVSEQESIGVGPQPSRTPLIFAGKAGGTDPGPQTVEVGHFDASTSFVATSDSAWLTVTPGSGPIPSLLNVSVSLVGLAPGVYHGKITLN